MYKSQLHSWDGLDMNDTKVGWSLSELQHERWPSRYSNCTITISYQLSKLATMCVKSNRDIYRAWGLYWGILGLDRGSSGRAKQGLYRNNEWYIATTKQYGPMPLWTFSRHMKGFESQEDVSTWTHFSCFVLSLTIWDFSFRFRHDLSQIWFLQFYFRYLPSVTAAEILQAVFRVKRLLSRINAGVPRDIEIRIKTNLGCRPFRTYFK